MYEVSLVKQELVDDVFPMVEGYMTRLEQRFKGRDTVSNMMAEIDAGRLSLWVVYRPGKVVAFFTLRIDETGYRRILAVPHVGGEEMAEWIDLVMETVRAYAKDQDCGTVETYGRPGWAKYYKKYGGRKTTETYEFKP